MNAPDRNAAKPTVSTRLERRPKLIERMSAKPKEQLLAGLTHSSIQIRTDRELRHDS